MNVWPTWHGSMLAHAWTRTNYMRGWCWFYSFSYWRVFEWVLHLLSSFWMTWSASSCPASTSPKPLGWYCMEICGRGINFTVYQLLKFGLLSRFLWKTFFAILSDTLRRGGPTFCHLLGVSLIFFADNSQTSFIFTEISDFKEFFNSDVSSTFYWTFDVFQYFKSLLNALIWRWCWPNETTF